MLYKFRLQKTKNSVGISILIGIFVIVLLFKTSFSEKLNYTNMLKQMFLRREISELKKDYFKDKEGNTYYVERIVKGSFIKPNEKNILLIIGRPKEEFSHVEGFYHIYLAVFDTQTKKILSDVLSLDGDLGETSFFSRQEGTELYSL